MQTQVRPPLLVDPLVDGAAVDDVIATWHDIAATLVPLLGKQGFGAVFLRAVSLQAGEDRALAGAYRDAPHCDDFVGLRRALEHRSVPEVNAVHRALFGSLRVVLVSLLGEPLCARLCPAPEAHASDATP